MKREKTFFFHNVKYCVTVCIGKEEEKCRRLVIRVCANSGAEH